MNKVILSGRICSEIELKTTANNVSVCSFRIAVNRRFKNAEGNYEADFISCVAWRSNADYINKYFSKGKPIEIVGNIQTRTYEKDGHKVFVTEVMVDEANFVIQDKTSNTDNAITTDENKSAPFDFSVVSDGFMPAIDADSDLPF